ncbi:MAG TPA: hypothetical protein VFF81_08935 [Noviherbaspirillum sp.]|nr:hypothetical protein [Noviherbaspirillum sp.]
MSLTDEEPKPIERISIQLMQKPPLFSLGQIVATRGVVMHLQREGIDVSLYLSRHVRGDWGGVPPEDAAANQWAVSNGMRILSSYRIAGEKVWIITEADRSVTTLLFPNEY